MRFLQSPQADSPHVIGALFKTKNMKLTGFTNLIDLLTYFKDEGVCSQYLAALRWSDGMVCPFEDCKGEHIHTCANNKYKCAKCKRIYSVRVGTMFEDSRLPLQKWFAAIYLVTAHKKGISSLQLHRDIGVTQKTAWFLLHRIRHTLGLPHYKAFNKQINI